ncbi:hypothetical protein ACUJ46_01680 [Sandaracinobacteroides sp. A072]|uniref:hypothetical protein n=1 Tax=Sandaracinobacteroides sp. A072 TaxID=3461146 RepID=UPI004042B228
MARERMTGAATRLLPWAIAFALVLVLIFAPGKLGERRAPPAPSTGTAIVTEAADGMRNLALPDGSTLMLDHGHPAIAIAAFLDGPDPAPRAFAIPDDPAVLFPALSALMRAYPGMAMELRGPADEPLEEGAVITPESGMEAQGGAPAKAPQPALLARAEAAGMDPARLAFAADGATRPVLVVTRK